MPLCFGAFKKCYIYIHIMVTSFKFLKLKHEVGSMVHMVDWFIVFWAPSANPLWPRLRRSLTLQPLRVQSRSLKEGKRPYHGPREKNPCNQNYGALRKPAVFYFFYGAACSCGSQNRNLTLTASMSRRTKGRTMPLHTDVGSSCSSEFQNCVDRQASAC